MTNVEIYGQTAALTEAVSAIELNRLKGAIARSLQSIREQLDEAPHEEQKRLLANAVLLEDADLRVRIALARRLY